MNPISTKTSTNTPHIQITNTFKPVNTPTAIVQEIAQGCPSSDLPGKVYELTDGILQGVVAAMIIGSGLQDMEITIQSIADFSFFLQILPGTIFTTENSDIQTMVSRECLEFDIDPAEIVSITLDAACASMNKKEPSNIDSFTAIPPVLKIPEFTAEQFGQKEEYYLQLINHYGLYLLVSSKEFQEEDNFRIQQFAIWIITDDPAPDEFVEIGSYTSGAGPSYDELVKIKNLFVQIGLRPEGFKAFTN